LKKQLEEQRKERIKQYNTQIRDLRRSIEDRLKQLAMGIAAEIELTREGAKAIFDDLYWYFGPGGAVQKLYEYYKNYLAQQDMSAPFGLFPWLDNNNGAPGGFAQGGSFIATRPIQRTFGEVPELVNITPLSGIGKNIGKFFGDISGGSIGDRSGTVAVELFLSRDLEARILEQSMENMSDVLVKVSRTRA